MYVKNYIIQFQTSSTLDFFNVTKKINAVLRKAGIQHGIVSIQSLHTTMAVVVNEEEPLLIEDMKKMLERLAPSDAEYQHNDFDIRTVNMCDNECKNGHSHCKALHLPTAKVLNVVDGSLQLGQWQQVFAVELDSSRPRKLAIQVMGIMGE